METEMLLIQLKNLKLAVENNQDILVGDKLIFYQYLDKMHYISEQALLRRIKWKKKK